MEVLNVWCLIENASALLKEVAPEVLNANPLHINCNVTPCMIEKEITGSIEKNIVVLFQVIYNT